MEKRPLSLTIIAWLLIVGAVFSALGLVSIGSNPVAMAMLENSGMPLVFHQAVGMVGIVISLACAYGIFAGQPWSRVLYVGWGLVGLAISIVTLPMISTIVLSLVVLAIFAFFLFRPAADRWFAARGLGLQREE